MGGDVDEEEGREDVVRDVLAEPRPDGSQHLPPTAAEYLHDGQLAARFARRAAGGPRGEEHGGLGHGQPDPQADHHQDAGEQERHAPAPGQERRVRLHGGEQREHPGGQQVPAGRTGLGPRGPEAAAAVTAVLGDDQHGPAPLTAEGEPLDQPQHGEQDRRPDPDARVGRQQPHREGRPAHHEQAEDEQLLAAEPVPEVPEHHPAERPGQEPDRVGDEGDQGPGQRVTGGEEQLVEHQRGGGAVEEEVVPLDGGPDQTRGDDAPDAAGTRGRCGRGGHEHHFRTGAGRIPCRHTVRIPRSGGYGSRPHSWTPKYVRPAHDGTPSTRRGQCSQRENSRS